MPWLPEADLSGLTVKQKEQERQLLVEEADVFATSDDDVGCIPKLEMDIRLTSDQPVQKKRSNCDLFYKVLTGLTGLLLFPRVSLYLT